MKYRKKDIFCLGLLLIELMEGLCNVQLAAGGRNSNLNKLRAHYQLGLLALVQGAIFLRNSHVRTIECILRKSGLKSNIFDGKLGYRANSRLKFREFFKL